MRVFEWIGTCVGLCVQDLDAFDESSREVKYETVRRHLRDILTDFAKEVGYKHTKRHGLTLKKDWHVSYATGRWKGQFAVCIFHSGIHHIWAERKVE